MRQALLALLAVAAFLAGAPLRGQEASVLVKTEPLREHLLEQTLVGYGTLAPEVGATVDLNLPRPGQVSALRVSVGQVVRKGSVLLEYATQAAASLAYREAETALEYAREELARTEKLAAQHLATNSQLSAARKAVTDAEGALQAQRALGTGIEREQIRAPFDGVVTQLLVAPGSRVPAGTTLMRLARQTGLRVLLGIEPSDSYGVRRGMPVGLKPVFDATLAIKAQVAEVHGMVNPQTQLVDVVVRAPGGNLLPGTRVRGEIRLAGRRGWAVPRSAVLQDAAGAYVFQVEKGIARRIAVHIEGESGGLVGIRGALDPARRVVVLGNYELRDGMAVREGPQ